MFSPSLRTADPVGRAAPALLRALTTPRAPFAPVRCVHPAGFAALLAGTWRIVERVEATSCVHLIAQPYVAPSEHMRSFATRQAQKARAALELATSGAANKVIALELDISQSTVTRMITRALEALQLADLREAMALARTDPDLMEGEAPACRWIIHSAPRCDWTNLTVSERDIVERVVSHASRADIARARGTSLFTVNSQLATIFAKLHVSSRRELLQLAAGAMPPSRR